MKDRKPDFKALAVLLAIELAFFSHVLFTDKLLYGWDVVHNEYYWRTWTFSSIKEGVLPLWNPWILTGYPMFTNPSEGHFYPLNLIFTFLPAAIAIKWSFIIHIYLLGAFQYLFLRSLRITRGSSLFGAAAFMLTGYVICGWVFTGNIAQLHTTTWMPLLFLFVRLSAVKKSARLLIPGAVALGAQFLGGNPELFFYSCTALLIYWAAAVLWPYLVGLIRREGPSLAPVAGFPAMFLGGIALAAGQFLPTLMAIGQSDRAQPINIFRAGLLAVSPENLLTFLIPDIYGDGLNNYYWGDVIVNLMTGYVGLLPLFFFIWAFRARKDATTKIFFWLGVFCLLISMGLYTPVFWFFYNFVPGFNLFRFFPRWLVIFSFCCSTVAAGVMDRLCAEQTGEAAKKFCAANTGALKGIAAGALCLCALAFASELGFGVWKAFDAAVSIAGFKAQAIETYFPGNRFALVTYAQTAAALAKFLILLGGYYVLLRLLKSASLRGKALKACFILFLLADLFSFGRRYVLDYDPAPLEWSDDMADFMHERLDDGRIATLAPVVATPLPKNVLANFVILNKYNQSLMNRGMIYRLPNVAGYISIQLSRYLNVTAGMSDPDVDRRGQEFDLNFIIRPHIADFAGARLYVLATLDSYKAKPVENPFSTDGIDFFVESLPGMKEVYRNRDFVVLENPNAFPRLHFYRTGVQVTPDGKRIGRAILDPDTDLEKELYLETDRAPILKLVEGQPEGAPPPAGWDPNQDRAEIVEYENNEVVLHANARDNGFLLMTDAYYPDWHTEIDGVETNILRADYLFRAFPVRKGFHEIRMDFRPRSFRYGVICSGAAMLVLYPLLLIAYSRRREED